MKTFTLALFMTCLSLTAFGTTWVVVNDGFTFSPPTLTIAEGDTVIFDLDNVHTVLEVSQATWNANGTTPLPGGFSLPLGGGTLFPEDLTEGTHFYVCEPHASGGMKGMIIVEGTTANDFIADVSDEILIYPNPTTLDVRVDVRNAEFENEYAIEVFDLNGRQVHAKYDLDPLLVTNVDLSHFNNGMYLMKIHADGRTYSRKVVVQ